MNSFKYMRKRDWIAVIVGGYVGAKGIKMVLKRVLPRK